MRPIRLAWTKTVYKGPSAEVGDLWTHRVQPGLIESVWLPSESERKAIAEGGAIVLALHTEPIPPISMRVLDPEDSVPVAEHGWKIPEELAERERQQS